MADRCGALSLLVLWDPCLTGRSFLGEQKVLQLLEIGRVTDHEDGTQEALGFVYPPNMARSLRALSLSDVDLAAITFDGSNESPCLVLTRGDQPYGGAISKLADSSFATRIDANEQYEMLGKRSFGAQIPRVTISTIVDFLDGRLSLVSHSTEFTIQKSAVVTNTPGGRSVVERFERLGPHEVFSVITEIPSAREVVPVLLFTNVAAEYHIGPGRAWVELAREAARFGIRCIRIDRPGVGDSAPGESPDLVVMYTSQIADQLADLVRWLRAEGYGPIGALGSCSGAWEVVAAGAKEKLDAVWLINVASWNLKMSAISGSEMSAIAKRGIEVRPTRAWFADSSTRSNVYSPTGLGLDCANLDSLIPRNRPWRRSRGSIRELVSCCRRQIAPDLTASAVKGAWRGLIAVAQTRDCTTWSQRTMHYFPRSVDAL